MSNNLLKLIIGIFFLIAFSLQVNAETGCCYQPSLRVCSYVEEIECASTTNVFYRGQVCDSVEECKIGCCCESPSKYPELKGICESTYNGRFLQINEQQCNQVCSSVFEVCEVNQQIPSQGCLCNFTLQTSGFCCWDNSYKADQSQCPTANNCELHVINNAPYNCCDGCLNDNLIYPSAYYDGSPNNCPSDKKQCCEQCAPSYLSCCDYDWQCPIEKRLPYSYSSCPVPCNTNCIEASCLLYEQINKKINGVPINKYPKCECAGEYYDTTTESRYCCLDGIKDSCIIKTFSISGYIYSGSIGNRIGGAGVTVNGNTVLSAITNSNGEYLIQGIPIGFSEFNVTIVKSGYRLYLHKEPYPSDSIDLSNRNFNLQPSEPDVCDRINPPAVSIFQASHIKGVKAVSLEWQNPCLSYPSKVVDYLIRRTSVDGLKEIITSGTRYIDYNVRWNTLYTYSIKASYISGANSSETNTLITTGNKHCENIFGNEEFCLNRTYEKGKINLYRYKCDKENKLSLIEDCIDTGALCVGPDENDKTFCKTIGNCKYDEANPFGLFYTKQSCEENNKNCYYDYSDTTTDNCYTCNLTRSCYDYRSSDSCLTDNCEISGKYVSTQNSECNWIDVFDEFGKGICYDLDYNGVDYCSLCNRDSGLFKNANCDFSICKFLGNCHSNGLSCLQCNAETTCEMFDIEEECVNANPLIGRKEINFLNNCPAEIISSNDACDIGLCKWGIISGENLPRCYKDADDNNIPDCDNNPAPESCRKDRLAFETNLYENIPKMNMSGNFIHLNINGNGQLSNFTFCIDKTNTCCPTISKLVQPDTKDIYINPVKETGIIDKEGVYYIRYYTTDSNKNIEKVKTTSFFVDPVAPITNMYYYSYALQGHNYTDVILTLNEFGTCNYQTDMPSNKVKQGSSTFNSNLNNTFKITFVDLNEGYHTFTYMCKDAVGNSIQDTEIINIDRVSGAIPVYPNLIRIKDTSVTFVLETLDNSTCLLYSLTNNQLPKQPILMAQEKITNTKYNHTVTVNNLQADSSYIIGANCTKIDNARDYATFYFTIDKKAPTTTTSFDFSKAHKLEQGQQLIIPFKCNDPDIGGTPGEAGCDGFYICAGYNCNNFILSPTKDYPVITSTWISYYSKDNLGNEEQPIRNKYVIIDNNAPSIRITVPKDNITGNKQQTISGVVEDTGGSGVSNVTVTIFSATLQKETISTAQLISNTFKSQMELYDGLNSITSTAYDKAGNFKQDQKEIYLDVFAPVIDQITLRDSDIDIDQNNVFEYMENITFSARIRDLYNERYGIGVDKTNALVKIKYENGDDYRAFNLVNQSNDYYTYILSQKLPIGNYFAIFEAKDVYGNLNSQTVLFEIRDTKKPSLSLYPDLPSVVYTQAYTISGTTDANLPIKITIYDENWENPETYDAIALGEIRPKPEFANKLMGDLLFDQYPEKGDKSFIFKGDLSGVLLIGDYLEFSNHRSIPRYQIVYRKVLSYGVATRINISAPLAEDVIGSAYKVSAFTHAYPTGWFNVYVNFRPGINRVIISAIEPTGQTNDLVYEVRYDIRGFDVNLTNPSDGVINYNDFDNAGNAIPVQISTQKDGAGLKTSCKITHSDSDIIARAFKDLPMASDNNGFIHTFTINSNSCKEKGGDYCLIGGTSQYPINYHHYLVNCTPLGINMKPQTKNICFKVTTYGMQSGSQPRGNNICASVGCGSTIPSPCEGEVNCQDTLHSSSQSNCISEGVCKWSIGYGCAVSCYPGFNDDNNDGVCTQPAQPTVNCADYHNNRNDCLSQIACKWCPSRAISNANKCLQSCSSCSLTEDSNPLDRECDEGTTGQGGWRD